MKKFILLLIFILLIVYFATTNSNPILVKLGTTSFEIPLSIALILPLVVSLLIFTLFYMTKTHLLKRKISALESQLNEIEDSSTQFTKEIHSLKLENKKLKTKLGIKSFDDESL